MAAQKRASGDPYFAHPLEVAAILTDLKLDDATIAVALLHDTIEDTDATRAEIDQLFGAEIGAIVEGLTKIERLNLVTREEAQAENLRKLLLAISADVRVLLVKLADRLHNMRTLRLHAGRKAARGSPPRRWISMPRWPGAWACRTCAPSSRTSPSRRCSPSTTRPSPTGSREMQAGVRRDHRDHQGRTDRQAAGAEGIEADGVARG